MAQTPLPGKYPLSRHVRVSLSLYLPVPRRRERAGKQVAANAQQATESFLRRSDQRNARFHIPHHTVLTQFVTDLNII